jgi:hypothetical protein
MPIPAFVDGRLPPGTHPCTWEELETCFSLGDRRQELTVALHGFFDSARDCGFAGIVVGGSYVSEGPNPGDLDLLFITPRNFDRSNLLLRCAELLVNDAAFKRRTGHNGLNCPDDAETIDSLVFGLGHDLKTGRDRGMLLLRFR